MEKNILKEIHHLFYICFVLGDEIYNFLSPYPTNAIYKIRLRLAQCFLRRCSCTTDTYNNVTGVTQVTCKIIQYTLEYYDVFA